MWLVSLTFVLLCPFCTTIEKQVDHTPNYMCISPHVDELYSRTIFILSIRRRNLRFCNQTLPQPDAQNATDNADTETMGSDRLSSRKKRNEKKSTINGNPIYCVFPLLQLGVAAAMSHSKLNLCAQFLLLSIEFFCVCVFFSPFSGEWVFAENYCSASDALNKQSASIGTTKETMAKMAHELS